MVNTGLSYEEGKRNKRLDFEDTELRLGLPSGGENIVCGNYGKRGYGEITMDLKLNLGAKEVGLDIDRQSDLGQKNLPNDSMKPPAKAQVVGWPPVGSFRKNMIAVQKGGDPEGTEKGSGDAVAATSAAFVKVSMHGAPYLRKVDLKTYKTYQELSDALCKMFGSFTMAQRMNESKLMDLLNNSDYVPTYEDKDGDWMLVGDVPWKMFVESCKRLRIIKGTEAKGLAPRAMEKCKSRS